MNVKMLKALVELAGNEVMVVDVDDFFRVYPRSEATRKDLLLLKQLGYIAYEHADNEISLLGVNKKALDYFCK
jgi:hypothetical protein